MRWLLLGALACSADPGVELEPAIQNVAGMLPERTYYVRSEGRAIFGGFDGALERPLFAAGVEVVPDADGRFRVELPPEPTLELENGLTYRLRDPELARSEAVRAPLSGAGNVPNDLVLDEKSGLLVRSGDGGVSRVDLERGLTDEGVRVEGRPFFAVLLPGERAAVSDFDGGGIQLLDLEAGTVERTLAAPRITLAAPFALSRPVDLDGDGATETEVLAFDARSPQSLAATSDRLLAAYSGFVERRLDEARGPVFVPGVVAAWSLLDLDAPPRVLVLDALDPQEVRVLQDGRALAVSSGVIDQQGGVRVLTDGAVTIFDPERLAVLEQIPMGDFAPSSALFVAGRLVVASLARARVRVGGAELALNDEAVDSIFRLVDLGGGLVGAPSFNTDRLHLIDARTAELDPPPFFGPLAVGPGRPVFDGLQIVASRLGRRGVDFTGPDLLALTGIASELVPIELRKVLGP